jgi:nucleotide-binding universal stress UspA family protein
VNADMPISDPPRKKRVLVALDADEDAQRLLEIAADMAQRMKADLMGLFIEDSDLLGLGDNPLVRRVSSFAGASGAIRRAVIEQAMRRQTTAARIALEQAAAMRRIQTSFEVRRGRLAAALESYEETDFILVRRAAPTVQHTPGTRRARISAATRQVITAARRPVIVLDMRWAATAPAFGRIATLFDGSPETEKALLAAAEIADRRRGDGISVVPVTTSEADADALARRAQDILRPLGHQPHIAAHVTPDLDALCAMCSKQGGGAHSGVLVLHADHALLQGEAMAHLLDSIDCSVMVVR